ncbi:hypothetical protein D3C84_942430 [compost metagenome]
MCSLGSSRQQPVHSCRVQQLPLAIEITQTVSLQLGFLAKVTFDKTTHIGTGIPQSRVTGTAFCRDVAQ